MHIQADVSTNPLTQSIPQNLQSRQDPSSASSVSSQTSSSSPSSATTSSELAALLPRLPEAPSSLDEGDLGSLDEAGANHLTASLTQNITAQPKLALGAHANQISANVLSLLQPAD